MREPSIKPVFFASALFLAAVAGAACGWAVEKYHIWPYALIDSAQGAARSIAEYGEVVPEGRRIVAPDSAARERFTVHDRSRMAGGYYVFAGWDEEQGRYGAWLYDANGKRLHAWSLDYGALDSKAAAGDDGPHGLDVLPDGSVIVNFDHGRLMARLDQCSRPVWKKPGIYHHLLSRADDGSYWVWRGDGGTPYGHYHYLENFDAGTGAKRREIGLIEDVLRADGAAPVILGVRPDFGFRKFESDPKDRSREDLFHPNDIEPLGTDLAPRFPMFEAGDLLVSIRVLNLVAVIDPDDNRLKWWSHGPWRGQHDADFTGDGAISVYNNNTGRGRSEILRIDPATRAVTNALPDSDSVFYSPYMGTHQYLPNGNVLIAAPGEGRVLELSPTGGLVMEFNNLPEAGSRFNDHVENAIWLEADYFETSPKCGEGEA
jgi:phage tail protein X